MLGKNSSVIGLDLEADSVKAVELRVKDGRLSPVRFFISYSYPEDKTDFDSKLAGEFRKVELNSRRTVATLPRGDVYLRKASFPRMPENELESVILAQARGWEHLPQITSGGPLIDYAVIDSSEESYEVIVALAEREEVNRYLSRMRSLRLKPLAVEAVPFALARFSNRFFKSDSRIALVDIGAGVVTFAYTLGGRLRFTRQFPTGDPELSNFIRRCMREPSGSPPDIERLIPSLAEQIRKTLDFCLAELRESSVDAIVLVGDGAASREISSGLKDMLGPEVRPLLRIRGLSFEGSGSYAGFPLKGSWQERVVPRLVAAIGAAFRGISI